MKKLLCILLGALLLVGCGKSQPEATTAATTQPVTVPADTTTDGVYVLTEQVYYDHKDRQSVTMTVSFDDKKLPTSIFMDSGTDITYTLVYGENGLIAGFNMVRTLYGEETTSSALVNDHGDIISKTADGKNSNMTYSYDQSGRVIKKETFTGDNLTSVKTWAYDDQGNLSKASSTNVNGGYTLIYENTYSGTLLTSVHCKYEGGDTEHTESFTYDQEGRLTQWSQVVGEDTTVINYTYNKQGLVETETTLLNGQEKNRLEYTYDDSGLLAEKKNYEGGQYQGRTTYSWTSEPVQLTDAQQNILKQLGALL